MSMPMQRATERFGEATRPELHSSPWGKPAPDAAPGRDAAPCLLCARDDADARCFVNAHGKERPACRACWEQLVLDPRRVIASIVRGLL